MTNEQRLIAAAVAWATCKIDGAIATESELIKATKPFIKKAPRVGIVAYDKNGMGLAPANRYMGIELTPEVRERLGASAGVDAGEIHALVNDGEMLSEEITDAIMDLIAKGAVEVSDDI